VASEKVQGAAAGASYGAKIGSVVPGVGTAIGAGIGAIAGAVFGGKGSYAQTAGHEVNGFVSASGFQGDFIGLADNAGTKYRDVLGQSGLNDVARVTFRETFGSSDVKIPVAFVGSPDSETFWEQFRNVIRGAAAKSADPVKSADPIESLVDIFSGGSSAVARKAPTVVYQSADPAAPQQGSGISIASHAPAGGSGLGILALLAGAFYAVTHV